MLPGMSHRRACTLPGCHKLRDPPPWDTSLQGCRGTDLPRPASSNAASLHAFPRPQDIYESFDTRQRRASSPGYIDSPTYSRQGMSPTIPRSPHHFYRSGEDFSYHPQLG